MQFWDIINRFALCARHKSTPNGHLSLGRLRLSLRLRFLLWYLLIRVGAWCFIGIYKKRDLLWFPEVLASELNALANLLLNTQYLVVLG